MAAPRVDDIKDLATLEAAYRRSLFTILGHGLFFIVVCAIAVIARRMIKMPPVLLTVVFIVAVLLFGGDFLRFLAYRRRLRQLREKLF